MYIIMHCGGMPFNGETVYTQSLGGSETAAYYSAKNLAKLGHKVTLFTNSQEEGIWDGVHYRYAGQQSEKYMLGDRYHVFSVATPHDLNITQRSPFAFQIPVAAKVKAWWLHDVPVKEYQQHVDTNLLKTDMIFVVSQWQKDEICKIWDINPDIVYVVENGIDLSLFPADVKHNQDENKFKLLYTSRPERGLETLVRPGGVMDQLQTKLPKAHLYVCGYDNVAKHMVQYYQWLYQQCEKLPNVTNVGHLTKKDLAILMAGCDLLTYPTIFNETSCITAMEAMAARLPLLSSYQGALPETCKESGSILLPLLPSTDYRPGMMEVGDKDVEVDLNRFVDSIIGMSEEPQDVWRQLETLQANAAEKHTWELVAKRMDDAAKDVFDKASPESKIKYLMTVSDIYALDEYVNTIDNPTPMFQNKLNELKECYDFRNHGDDWSEHYKEYYKYEKDRGIDYGPENLDNNNRFEYVSSIIGNLPDETVILDYGCAHGHYTINLAKRFPNKRFVGVDITQTNIDTANEWARSEGISNIEFALGHIEEDITLKFDYDFDAIIAAEVLEHVPNPLHYVNVLHSHLKSAGRMIITTPYGGWEAIGYEQHYPWRAHVHHFEREDWADACGHFNDFNITVVSSGRDPNGEPIGSFVVQFTKTDTVCRAIDYDRKLAQLSPRQTLSVCMIAKDAAEDIGKTLKSVLPIADELIIGIDNGTVDNTVDVIKAYVAAFAPHIAVNIISIESPLVQGFDEARNKTIEKASCDWILWIDSDEILNGIEQLPTYLVNNQYNGYGLAHHHFSMDPPGILKTDYPMRVFRNNKNIRFFGVVHEHPEVKVNDGIPHHCILSGISIAHYGYTNERIRRERFNRNYPLLIRDHEKYPERTLGKFLWLRDLYQLNIYELEQNPSISQDIINRSIEGIEIWADLVKNAKNVRFAIESLEWYTGLVESLGKGIPYECSLKSTKGEYKFKGKFFNEFHINLLCRRILKELGE